jgi:hypothetical protein
MKVIILVQSVDKPEYIKLRESQQLTWDSIPHPNIETFYYKPNSQTEEIIDNTINTPENENWINMYKSFVKALRLLINQNFDYIFKTDNSTYVDKKVLYNILSTKPRNNYFGGIYYPYFFDKTYKCIWGDGYVLSRDLVEYIVESFNKAPFLHSGADDGVVTKLLEDKVVLDETLPIYEIHLNNGQIKAGYHVYRVREELQSFSPAIKEIENLSEIIDSDIKSMYNIHNIITNGKSNNINSN